MDEDFNWDTSGDYTGSSADVSSGFDFGSLAGTLGGLAQTAAGVFTTLNRPGTVTASPAAAVPVGSQTVAGMRLSPFAIGAIVLGLIVGAFLLLRRPGKG